MSHEPASKGEAWIFLSSRDADLRDKAATEAVFARHRPTHVIHLAALVGGLFSNMAKKVEFYRENVLINDNVMEGCRVHNARLVSCLSTCIFPDKTTYPIDETMVHSGPPHQQRGLRVREADDRRAQPLLPRRVRLALHVGHPDQHLRPARQLQRAGRPRDPGAHPQVLRRAKQTGGEFTVWGSGTPLRQFIYSLDLAALMVWVLRDYDSIEPIILSVGEADEVSIRDVALMIAEAMEIDMKQVKFDTSKADGQYKKTACNDKLMKLRPDFKFTPMKEGIKKSVDWFVANYETARK